MGISGRASSRPIWRTALTVVAAYLLILQAALAGGATQRMQPADGVLAAVICFNGGPQDPAGDGHQHVAFDCCGMGCLIGAHALEGPGSPDSELTYPAERKHEPAAASGELRSRTETPHGPGLRGPPAAA